MKAVLAGASVVGAYDHEYWRQVGTAVFTAYYHPGGLVNHGALQTAVDANMLYAHPIVFPRGGTLDRIGTFISAVVGPPSLVRLGLYTATSTTNLYPNALVVDSGDLGIAPGFVSAVINTPVAANTLYWGVVTVWFDVEGACSLHSITRQHQCAIGGVSNAFVTQNGIQIFRVYGALPNPFPAGAIYGPLNYPTPLLRFSA